MKLLRAIEAIHQSSRKTYGSPRIHNQLRGMGYKVGKTKVERNMRKNGIQAKMKRKFRVTTDSNLYQSTNKTSQLGIKLS